MRKDGSGRMKKKGDKKEGIRGEGGRSRHRTYREALAGFLAGDIKLEWYQKVGILLLIAVISGFIGWLWEFSLQEIDGGFRHLYIKGGNLLPWISLYAIGAVVGLAVTYWARQRPWLVFVLAAFAMGALELLAGLITSALYNGARYWDYSGKWWGIGNIDGLVCPASAMVFGIGVLILIYTIVPLCIMVAERMTKRAFLVLTVGLFILVITDEMVNLTLKTLGLPGAPELYHALGWEYKN